MKLGLVMVVEVDEVMIGGLPTTLVGRGLPRDLLEENAVMGDVGGGVGLLERPLLL